MTGGERSAPEPMTRAVVVDDPSLALAITLHGKDGHSASWRGAWQRFFF
jgi:hypothetical protein